MYSLQINKKSLKKTKLHLTYRVHDLRHSYTHLLKQSVDIRYIQTLLDHILPRSMHMFLIRMFGK